MVIVVKDGKVSFNSLLHSPSFCINDIFKLVSGQVDTITNCSGSCSNMYRVNNKETYMVSNIQLPGHASGISADLLYKICASKFT